MNLSMPGLLVHHQLPEFTQTHVHRVSDAIHPLLSPSPPALNPSQHQGLFKWVNFVWGGQSIGVSASASVLPMNTQDWSPLQCYLLLYCQCCDSDFGEWSRVWLFSWACWESGGGGGLVIKSCQTLVTPWSGVCQAPLCLWDFPGKNNCVAILFSRWSSQPRDRACISCTQTDSLLLSHGWKSLRLRPYS